MFAVHICTINSHTTTAFMQKRISLMYTEKDWDALDKIVLDSGSKDLMEYLGKQLKSIQEKIDKANGCSDQVIQKRVRKMRTPPYISKILVNLECRHGIDAGLLVTRLVVSPALKQYYDENGY